ncbi:DUF5518 domain-containing protein [Natrarchaeobius sp. A-rgal3]|uniref:DUF5518 domain-containing protein n=1 Tax=Natrarchaeobius versutus TaxID=1679078 RepID=UPI00350F8E72
MSWAAVIAGFAVTLVLRFISGLVYVDSGASVVLLDWGGTSVLIGLIAGYLAFGTISSDAAHGGIATVLDSFIVFVLATLAVLFFRGSSHRSACSSSAC